MSIQKPNGKKAIRDLESAEPDEINAPPKKSNTGLLLLIGGAVVLVLLFCIAGPVLVGVAFFLMMPSPARVDNGPTSSAESFDTKSSTAPPTEPKPTPPVGTKPTPPTNTRPKPADPIIEPDDEPTGPKLDADPLREAPQPLSNPSGNLPLAFGTNNPVRYPWGPGPVVAAQSGKNKENLWEVWNLQSMKQLGSVPGSSGADVKLSVDGAYLAMPVYAPGSIKSSGLEIYTVTDGKPLRKVQIKAGNDSRIGIDDFAGPGQFLSLHNEGQGGVATVSDVKTGNQIATFKTVGQIDRKASAVSPGGKYLAMYDSFDFKHPIQVYELATGKVARTIKPRLPQASYHNCVGMAFSNDGKELAALIESDGSNALQAWDFETGKRTANHKFTPTLTKTAKAAGAYLLPMYPDPLECLPDRNGWFVYGQLMIDHDRGKVFWSLAPEDLNVLWVRRFLDMDHLATVMVKGPRQRQLEIITLPKDEIAAARKK